MCCKRSLATRRRRPLRVRPERSSRRRARDETALSGERSRTEQYEANVRRRRCTALYANRAASVCISRELPTGARRSLHTRTHYGNGSHFRESKSNCGVFQFVAYCTVQSCSFCTKRVNGPCSWSAYRHFLRLFAFDRRGLSLPSKPLVSTHFIVRLHERGLKVERNTHNNVASDLI